MLKLLSDVTYSVFSFLLLLVAHAVHAVTLLLVLLQHLLSGSSSSSPSSSFNTSQPARPAGLASDIARWRSRKLPKCLAVIFVPAARGNLRLPSLGLAAAAGTPGTARGGSRTDTRARRLYVPWEKERILDGHVQDIVRLVQWVREIEEVETLLLYDEKGILQASIAALQSALAAHFLGHASPKSRRNDDGDAIYRLSPSSNTLILFEGKLRITLLAEKDGREHLARVAGGLAEAVQQGYLDLHTEVDTDLVQEKLYSSLCPEPDLLLVLGGLHLRLRGFPPWHLRLCEIYHDSSLGLLGPPRLRYSAFRGAMDAYAGCEQRRGF